MTAVGHSESVRNVHTVTVRAAESVVRSLAGGAACALPADDVAALATHLVVRKLRSGQLVFAPGKRPDGVWIVQSGAVELTVGTGRQRLVTQILCDGDIFGDIPLLIDRASVYHARTVRSTTCLWLAQDDFLRLLAQRPAITRLWLSSCAARFFDSQERLPGLLDGPLPQRTAALLLREARGGVVALSQATLAAMLGVPRPSLNRVLQAFQQRDLISLSYRRVGILDLVRLGHAAHI